MMDGLRATPLTAAGLSPADTSLWVASEPNAVSGFASDMRVFSDFWRLSDRLLRSLPAKQGRNPVETKAAEMLHSAARAARERFLSAHAERIYEEATRGCTLFLRVEDLVAAVSVAVPGLVPNAERLAREAGLEQRDKDGAEIDQGIFLAHVLAHERTGLHLCHAMLLPRPESAEFVNAFSAKSVLDLGPVRLERRGRAVHLIASNARHLNAEDDTTLDWMEAATDVAILDRGSDIVVMRGGTVTHPKYEGRHIFGAGINLTHLYRGKIPFLWFLRRDLGYVHKILRGIARADAVPDDVRGWGVEKPWIAAVDGFAIGGHCQLLLCMDYVLAATDAFLTLPARKEGIIPGLANLRLPRFTGDRIARQAIQYERKLQCDSLEGRLICDEIVARGEMDLAIDRVVAGLTSSGSVSAVANRRAFRVGAEPIDLFRRYCSVYAREQAYCLFSPALIANLERSWDARNRKT